MRILKWTIIETSKLDEVKRQVSNLQKQIKMISDKLDMQKTTPSKEEVKEAEPELFTFERKEKPILIFSKKFIRNDEMYKNRIRRVYEMLPFNEPLNITMIRFYTRPLNLSDSELYYAIDYLVDNNYITKQGINKYIIH
jgi:hypothetical protein